MKFIKIKIRAVLPPKDNIYPIIDKISSRLKSGDILFITSKVLAIHQGRCTKISKKINKEELIKKEAEKFVASKAAKQKFLLTIKNYTLIPSAGIDESNGNGYYILWPKNPVGLAKEICQYLRKKSGLKKLAVVITDSHTIPLRYGVIGIAIGFWGLKPLIDYRGRKDIFGRRLQFTKVDIVDALAANAVLLMGEGKEKTPMIILRGADFVKFSDKHTFKDLVIPAKKDIYYPLLSAFKKEKNKNFTGSGF